MRRDGLRFAAGCLLLPAAAEADEPRPVAGDDRMDAIVAAVRAEEVKFAGGRRPCSSCLVAALPR
jgi:hypothetical protein